MEILSSYELDMPFRSVDYKIRKCAIRYLKVVSVFSIPNYFNSYLVNSIKVKPELPQFRQLEIYARIFFRKNRKGQKMKKRKLRPSWDVAYGFRQGLMPTEICDFFIALGFFTNTPSMFISKKFVLECWNSMNLEWCSWICFLFVN